MRPSNQQIFTMVRDGRRAIVAAAAAIVIASRVAAIAPADQPRIVVESVPDRERDRLALAEFYEQFTAVAGIPIVASGRVRPEAVAEAAWIVERMLARRPDVARALAASPVRVAVMAYDEFTTDIPEHADLRPAERWNRRARGLGATIARPAVSCGEENLLCFPGDPYVGENILVHEFAHTVHEIGLRAVDPTFQKRLEAAFALAKERDCWRGTYALTNPAEYWAEGVQSWLGCNRTGGGIHGELNSAAAVLEHDPPLAALLTEVFGAEPWVYVVPADRPSADRRHLAGFDPAAAPRFDWAAAARSTTAR
jgi:hypothetical protein